MPSTRCQQSLEIVLAYILKNEGVRAVGMSGPCRVTERVPFLFTFYIDNDIVRLKYYRLFRLKTT